MKLPKRSSTKAKPKKAYLFAYGELQSGSHHEPVTARGTLRMREDEFGKDAAARFGAQDHGIVYGQRLPVTMDTLRFLDEAEGPQYKRVAIDTQDGPAFAYSYVGKDWAGLETIPSGDYLKHVRALDAEDQVMDADSAALAAGGAEAQPEEPNA